ncbi:MAG: hypothetical protein GY853_09855 [PVC group bacterium]|nr:hypothetical protein [PVC group bacterium]
MNIKKLVLLNLGFIILYYLAISFYYIELNFAQWYRNGRLLFDALAITTIIISNIAYFLQAED